MADFRPFRAVRYNPARFRNLSRFICPPYDVISPKTQRAFYRRHPLNFIRLELPLGTPGGRYRKAARALKSWRMQEVLTHDFQEAFYLYEQRFRVHGKGFYRRGILGTLRLESFGKNIFPHEKTHAAPKRDRLRMLKALHADTSPIFALFPDKSGKFHGWLKRLSRSRPSASGRLEGISERIWRIPDSRICQEIHRRIASLPIFIADGHHRYETALAFRKSSFVLAFLCPVSDPGLIILPTHRLLSRWGQKKERLLTRKFAMRQVSSRKAFETLLEKFPRGSFGLYCEEGGFRPAPSSMGRGFRLIRARGISGSEVNWLHQNLLRGENGLAYTRNAGEAIRRVKEGEFKAAIFLKPTSLAEVLRAARQGKTLPQKSTYFYPKVSAGWVIHLF